MDEEVHDDERRQMIREVRQRLESLRRAGLDRFPDPPTVARRAVKAVAPPKAVLEMPKPAAVVTAEIVPTPIVHVSPVPPAPAPSLFGVEAIAGPTVAPADRPAALVTLAEEVSRCVRCPHLAASRTQTVFGTGSPTARLMFVGEAPGAEEDRTGEPFVGRAGILLTDMITKGMGLSRAEVYIANILKSRPPENRNPEPPEIANCLPYLERQIEIIRPEFLCLLGKIAASALLNTAMPLARLRGKWHRVMGIPTVVTYHPSYLLRVPADKKKAWEDLQFLMQAMGIQPPARRKPADG